MGGITSRDAGEEEIDPASTNAYRYPPKIGKKWKIYCKFCCILIEARLNIRCTDFRSQVSEFLSISR